MLAWENKDHIDETLADIEIVVEASINNQIYRFTKIHKALSIESNWYRVDLEKYKEWLKRDINITENLFSQSYFKGASRPSTKNTLSSMFRYNFFSDHDVYKRSKGSQYKIWLINASYDGSSKKPLFAYFLWVNLSQEEFQQTSKYIGMKRFIQCNETSVNKYKNVSTLFHNNNETELYAKYSNIKQKIWDICVAIDKLNELALLAVQVVWKDSEDHKFLLNQVNVLRILEKDLIQQKQFTKQEMESLTKIEKEKLLHSTNTNIIEKANKYNECIKQLPTLESLVNQSMGRINIKINQFYTFLMSELHKVTLLSGYGVDFDTNDQILKIKSWVNDAHIVLLRILSSLLVNIFSTQNWWRIPDFAFYDSIFEPIDEDQSHLLFGAINDLYNREDLKSYLPQLFVFIVWKNDKYELSDMNNINVSNPKFLRS